MPHNNIYKKGTFYPVSGEASSLSSKNNPTTCKPRLLTTKLFQTMRHLINNSSPFKISLIYSPHSFLIFAPQSCYHSFLPSAPESIHPLECVKNGHILLVSCGILGLLVPSHGWSSLLQCRSH